VAKHHYNFSVITNRRIGYLEIFSLIALYMRYDN